MRMCKVFHFLALWKSRQDEAQSSKPQSQFPPKKTLKEQNIASASSSLSFHTQHRPEYLENKPQKKSVADEHKNLESRMFLKSNLQKYFYSMSILVFFKGH